MPEKQSNKDRLKEITDSIEDGIKNLFESEKYMSYLRTMSRFHRYSTNNIMLIHLQRPDATLVAGFNKWRDQFSRNVIKGERGIKIIAPTPYKKKIEEEKLDPDTQLPMRDKDGNIIMEEKEIKIPMYKPVTVFDVNQTEGKPLPTLAADLAGNVQNYEVFMEALRRTSPVPIDIKPIERDTDGFFSIQNQSITLRSGMSEVQTVCAAVHEMAHALLHNSAKEPEPEPSWKVVMVSDGGTKHDFSSGFKTEKEAEVFAEAEDWRYVDENQFEWRLEVEEDDSAVKDAIRSRNTEEVQAESISYAVCAYYGIETGENSFGYIATWSKDKELPELRASLDTINKTASSLITDIDRNYAEIMKERGLDKVEPEVISEEAIFLIDDSQYLHVQLSDGVYDYTLYDKENLKEVDGGRLDSLSTDIDVKDNAIALRFARDEILALHEITPKQMVSYPDDMTERLLESIEAANAVQQEPVVPSVPEEPTVQITVEELEPVTAPDNGSVPDPTVSIEAMNAYGYTDADMLPLTKERAKELFERDIPIYMLYEGNSEGMVFDPEDIEMHSGLFGITREDWDAVKDTVPPMEIQERTPQRMEQLFMDATEDSFAIYQLKDDPELAKIRFLNTESMKEMGFGIDRGNYEVRYTAPLTQKGSQDEKLEMLYTMFNIHRPEDFKGHSLSVGDIVALKQDGVVSCHYVDSFGYKELPTFLKPDNYLKNAEMQLEDDYSMVDGIVNNGKSPTVAELEAQVKAGKPISLLDLAEAQKRENEQKQKEPEKPKPKQPKRPSVLAQLRDPNLRNKSQKDAPHKSAEMER